MNEKEPISSSRKALPDYERLEKYGNKSHACNLITETLIKDAILSGNKELKEYFTEEQYKTYAEHVLVDML